MKNEKLMRAMGEIDEDLILEAREARKPRVHWVRWSALAACLAFLMLCTPVLLVIQDGMGSQKAEMEAGNQVNLSDRVQDLEDKTHGSLGLDDVKEATDQIHDSLAEYDKEELLEMIKELQEKLKEENGTAQYRVGDTVRTDRAALVYQAADATSVSFYIKKTTNDPLVLLVGVYRVGEEDSLWVVSTDGEYRDYLSFTVNGETVTELPSETGGYDITVDLSVLTQNQDWCVSDWLVIEDICVLIWGNE